MKKGFTLIELIAVIVVLAIITLIAIPTLIKVVDKARKGAAEASALNYIDAVEKYVILHDLDSTKYPYDLKNNTFNVSSNTEISLLDIIIPKVNAEDNNSIPALNSFIKIKGKKPTSGTITTNKKGKVTSATLIYKKDVIECDSLNCRYTGKPGINIKDNDITLTVGGNHQLDVVAVPSNQKVIFESSDDSIASVSSDGVITAVTAGSVKITASIGTVSDSVNVTVKAGVKITDKSVTTIDSGKTLQLNATAEGTSDSPTWTSSNTNVATVSDTGLVTGKNMGSTTITAMIGSSTDTINITVRPTISIYALKAYSVQVDSTLQLYTTRRGTTSTVSWKSSDTKVATVSSNGKVKGIKTGTVTIKASVSGVSDSVELTITPRPKTYTLGETVILKDSAGNESTWYVIEASNQSATTVRLISKNNIMYPSVSNPTLADLFPEKCTYECFINYSSNSSNTGDNCSWQNSYLYKYVINNSSFVSKLENALGFPLDNISIWNAADLNRLGCSLSSSVDNYPGYKGNCDKVSTYKNIIFTGQASWTNLCSSMNGDRVFIIDSTFVMFAPANYKYLSSYGYRPVITVKKQYMPDK